MFTQKNMNAYDAVIYALIKSSKIHKCKLPVMGRGYGRKEENN